MTKCFVSYLRLSILALALPVLMLSAPAFGHPEAASSPPPDLLEVKAAGDSPRKVTPGEVVTTAFHVTNHSGDVLRATSSIELPDGWSLVLPVTGGALEPGQQVTRLVTIRVPARAAVGTYDVSVGFQSARADGATATATTQLLVQPKYGLDVQLGELPRMTQPGATLTSYVQIANRGNAPVTTTLRGADGEHLVVHPGTAQLRIPPQAVRRVALQIDVAEDLKVATRPLVSVTVSIQEVPDLSYEDAQFIDVVPAAPVNASEWQSLSTTVTMRMAGRGMQGGPQVEIAGGGMPFKHLGHEVEYLARIPYRSLPLRANLREAYRLRYKTESLDLRLGDDVYSLSPLSASPRQGRGGEVSAELGSWTAGGFYRQGRHYLQSDRTMAAYLSRDLGEEASMSTYYLGRRGRLSGQLVGVRSQLPLPNRTKLDAEVSSSMREEAFAGAYRLAVAGGSAGLTYNLRLLHTDLGFVGNASGQGTDVRSAHLAYSPASWLRLEGDWNKNHQEYGGSVKRLLGTESGGAGIHLDGRLSSGKLLAFVGYEKQSRTMKWGERIFERSSNMLLLRAGLRGRRSGLNIAAEVGRTAGTGLAALQGFQRYNVRGDISRRRLGLSASVEYESGVHIYSALPGERWSTSVNGQLELSPRSRLMAGASVYAHDSPRSSSRTLASRLSAHGRFKHEFASGHLLKVEGRYYAGGLHVLSGMPTYTLSYSIPIGIPIKQKTPPAQVQGRVLRGSGRQPLPNVLMRLGGTSVLTDRNGRFAFRSIPGGEHLLMLDPSSLEVGWTTRQHMPMELIIDPHHPTHVDIQVTESGSVSGQVMLYKWPEGMGSAARKAQGKGNTSTALEPVADRGLGGIVLEVSNGPDERRILSGRNGHFSTTGLYPGRWTLRAYPNGVPEHHYVEQEVIELDIRSDRESSIEVKVLPRNRKVRIIESGELDL